jgi:hypothetical protein
MPLTQVDQGLLSSTAQYTGFKNRIINSGMVIDQRNAGASVTITNTGARTYTIDRWSGYGSAASKFSIQQTPSATETGFATRVAAGFTNYLACTSASAYSVGSGDIFNLAQNIEGLNIADLGWGTASAKTVTLSFLAYSSLTGTFGGALTNSSNNRCYPFSYTISSANTWTPISITIAGDTSGTWGTGTGIGIGVSFSLGMGSTYTGTANAWTGSLILAPTGSVSVVGTNGATFYITGVQLEKGSTATSFDYKPYGTELQLCQRYYERWVNDRNGGGTQNIFILYGIGGGNAISCTQSWAVAKRTAPTVTISNNTNTNITSLGINSTTSNVTFQASVTSAGQAQMNISAGSTWLTADSEL